jgi:ribosome recycling factor
MIDDVLSNARQKMKKSVEFLEIELASLRTGRAAPGLVEHLKIDYSGQLMPLQHLAGISTPEASLILIQPWDKAVIKSIEKAILKSDLGLTPNSDGTVIRINVPPLSEERRLEMVKLVHHRVEDTRVAIRNLRREGTDELKKMERDKEISQDDHKRALDQLQKITDGSVSQAEQVGGSKENELKNV